MGDKTLTAYCQWEKANNIHLLSREEEKELSIIIQAGNKAKQELDTLDAAGTVPPEKEAELKKKIEEGAKAEQQLVQANIRFVYILARRYSMLKVKIDTEDIVQQGIIGLIEAAHKYDASINDTRFSTFSQFWIMKEFIKYIYEYNQLIYVPRNTLQLAMKIGYVREKHLLQGESIPSERKLAKELNTTPNGLRLANFALAYAYIIGSLDADFVDRAHLDGDSSPLSPYEIVKDENPDADVFYHLEEKELHEKVNECILEAGLTDREKIIITKRFGLDGTPPETLEKVGTYVGLTKEGVRLVQNKAMKKLQNCKKVKSLKVFLR